MTEVTPPSAPPPATRDDAERLLPCPFCGGAAVFGEVDQPGDSQYGGHFIQCTNSMCGASTNLRFACGEDPRPMLAEQWNRRDIRDASLATTNAELDAARAEIAMLTLALLPFANLLETRDYENKPDLEIVRSVGTMGRDWCEITVRDLRRAQSAAEPQRETVETALGFHMRRAITAEAELARLRSAASGGDLRAEYEALTRAARAHLTYPTIESARATLRGMTQRAERALASPQPDAGAVQKHHPPRQRPGHRARTWHS